MPIPAPTKLMKPRAQSSTVKVDSSRLQSLRPPTKAEDLETDTSDNVLLKMRPSLGRPPSFQNDSEGEKRRSLLPQPGQHKASTLSTALPTSTVQKPDVKDPVASADSSESLVSTSATHEANVRTALPGRLRPRSMYQTGIASSQRTEGGDKSAARSMRPPTSVSKPFEPQALGLGRSQSLRKPGVSTQPATSTGTTVHSRTHSTGAGAANRRDTSKTKSSSERPKSLLIAPDSSLKLNGVPADMAPTETRTFVRVAVLNRSISDKTKAEVLTGGASTDTAPRAEEPLVTHSRRRGPVSEESKTTSRPAFTTLQQHFTPRKMGKAPTATFLHPTTAAGNICLPPEVVNLQAEILQLHILHQSSAQVSRYWELSAKRGLYLKFEEVASMYQAMLDHEREGQEQINLQSLLQWSAGGTSAGLVEQIQVLSEPLHELPSLIESGGRLQRLVSAFQQWMNWVQHLRSARQKATGSREDSGTIEGLGDSWKAETASLTRKLTSFARDLDQLDGPSPGSSIACIQDTCKSLLLGILDELQTMQTIEADVVTKEKEWVEDRLGGIARDLDTHLVDTSEQIVAWRM